MRTCQIKVVTAWWLRPYLYALAAFCAVTRLSPDEGRLTRIIQRALTVKVVDV